MIWISQVNHSVLELKGYATKNVKYGYKPNYNRTFDVFLISLILIFLLLIVYNLFISIWCIYFYFYFISFLPQEPRELPSCRLQVRPHQHHRVLDFHPHKSRPTRRGIFYILSLFYLCYFLFFICILRLIYFSTAIFVWSPNRNLIILQRLAA